MMKIALEASHADEREVDGDVGSIFPRLKMCLELKEAEQSTTGDSVGYKFLGARESSD